MAREAQADVSQLRTPPYSVEAEQSVIGGLLLDNRAWDQVADRLTEADFYRQDHRILFRAIASLVERGQPFDVVTLSEALDRQHELETAGGLAYLSELARNTPSAANIRAYADIVRERSVLRQLIAASTDIGDVAMNPEGRTSGDVLDYAEQRVFEIAEQGTRNRQGFASIKSLLSAAVERIDTLFHQDSSYTGIATGFPDVDRLTSGLQQSDLIILAARPSMGKTALAMNLAEHAAIKQELPVAVFSMEMSGEQLAMRLMSSLGRIDQHKVRNGRLEDEDWPRLMSAIGILNEAPLFIDDTPGLNPMELRARARRLMREQGNLGLVIVDYLQLMQVPASRDNRALEISEISRALKGLAKELNVPVVALSQLNRGLEQRPNKRPVMSDLRESGAIEQDADVIMFIYRDEVYNEDSPDKGTAEVIISKQRNGPTGTIRLAFLGQYTRFENYAPEDYVSEGSV